MKETYRQLGRTGLKVSPFCLGCMNFGQKTPEQESIEIIAASLYRGINFIDTANAYKQGESELIVGKALQQNKARDTVVLTTKVHFPMSDDPNSSGNNRRHIIEQCEASLKRLRTDRIDLYLLHRPQSSVPIDESLRALDDLIKQGKVRYIGTSSFAAWQVMEALWVSKELHLNRFVVEQPPYHLLDRRIERELLPMAATYGIGVMVWSPLAGGFLSGKYRRDNIKSTEGRLEGWWHGDHFTEPAFQVLDRLDVLAKQKNATVGQIALAWCLARKEVSSVIIGPRTMDHLQDNLGAVNLELTDEDLQSLDRVSIPGRVIGDLAYYDWDFGPHPFRW